MPELLLAAATVDVTPPAGHRLDGYAARAGVANGTADPLRATLIWLSTAEEPGVLWLTLDAVGVSTSLAARLAATARALTSDLALTEPAGAFVGVPADRVLVCASHTHSGPSGWSGTIHPLLPAEREADLEDALVAAISGVTLTRVPVEPYWCVPNAPGVGTNRHRIDGPHDTTSGVLALRSPSGSVEAVLLDYACHPTVLGPDNLAWSADWPGAARRALAAALSGLDGEADADGSSQQASPVRRAAPVVGFLQGAAGDVSPRFVRRGRGVQEVARLGALLAGPVLRELHDTAQPLAPQAPRLHRSTLTLPVRTFPSLEETTRTLTEAQAALTRAETSTAQAEPEAASVRVDADAAGLRLAQSRLEGACGLVRMRESELPSALDLPISVVTFGDVAWVHLPVELFASLGQRIRQGSPFAVTRVVGYTDGYFGYVADRAAHEAGTYEALMSYLDADAGEALVDAAIDLLHSAHTPPA